MFKGPDTDINLHVLSSGCREIDRMLMFRDWLRDNPADRDLYARAKQALARKEWTNVQEYADTKTAIVEEIIARARKSKVSEFTYARIEVLLCCLIRRACKLAMPFRANHRVHIHPRK